MFPTSPSSALAEITTPLQHISKGGMSLGEAIKRHMNDRLKDPKGGGLYGPRKNWLPEVPGYDTLHKTHPLLFPLVKQDGLILIGDPFARLQQPPKGTYLELARGAADHLIATAARKPAGLTLE